MTDLFEVVAQGHATQDADENVTVTIDRAFPAAERILAGELRVGDRVFNPTGGTHALTRVSRRHGWVDTVREDGWPDRFHHTDVITVIREA